MELTYEQWKEANPIERAEYFKWVASQIKFDKKGNIENLEVYSIDNYKLNVAIDYKGFYYRVKRAPKYRPFKDIAEFIPHVDRWFKWKDEDIYRRIYTLNNSENTVNEFCFQELFDECEFIDLATGERSPFGVEVEE